MFIHSRQFVRMPLSKKMRQHLPNCHRGSLIAQDDNSATELCQFLYYKLGNFNSRHNPMPKNAQLFVQHGHAAFVASRVHGHDTLPLHGYNAGRI